MSIKSVGAILLFSDNPEMLVEFYRDKLGLKFEVEEHGGAIAHWGCMVGNVHFAIHHSRVNRGKPGVAFSLTTPDLESELGKLKDRGVVPLHPPIDMGNGARRSTVHDPDGNVISLVHLADSWK